MEKVSAGKKLYEQVVERVNDMIARGLYKKDDLLPSEKELMEMMGVSRVTVREALRLLGEAGVIRTQKGKGSYVLVDASQFSGHEDVLTAYPKAFMESTDLRILLEPAVARRVATCASEEERRAIGDYLDDFDRELEDFHMSIILAAHNGMLTETFRKVINTENMPSILTLVPPSGRRAWPPSSSTSTSGSTRPSGTATGSSPTSICWSTCSSSRPPTRNSSGCSTSPAGRNVIHKDGKIGQIG